MHNFSMLKFGGGGAALNAASSHCTKGGAA